MTCDVRCVGLEVLCCLLNRLLLCHFGEQPFSHWLNGHQLRPRHQMLGHQLGLEKEPASPVQARVRVLPTCTPPASLRTLLT